MKVTRNFWLSNIIVPLLVALIVSLLTFVATYFLFIKPNMEESQAQFQGSCLINNVYEVQNYINELEDEDKPAAKEKLEEVEGHLYLFKQYYNNHKFKQASDETDKGDELGREYFPDVWALYPQGGEEELY